MSATEVTIVPFPSPLFEQVDELRHSVLFEPFGVPREDGWNDGDPCAVHALAVDDGRVVGYARLLVDASRGDGQVRQVCVRPSRERRGIGTQLMQRLAERASELGLGRVWLEARTTAVPFYERLGFTVTSSVHPSGRTGLPHVTMERAL